LQESTPALHGQQEAAPFAAADGIAQRLNPVDAKAVDGANDIAGHQRDQWAGSCQFNDDAMVAAA